MRSNIASDIAIEAIHHQGSQGEYQLWNTVYHAVLVDGSMYRREVFQERDSDRIRDSGWVRRGTLRKHYHQFINTMLDMGFIIQKGPRFREFREERKEQSA